MQNETQNQTLEMNGQVIPLGAGERARGWLAQLLNQVYQAHGQEAMNNPVVQGLKGLLPMAGAMVPAIRPLAGLLSTVEASGPGILVANIKLTDKDAVEMLDMFYAALVEGYREVLGVEIEAE